MAYITLINLDLKNTTHLIKKQVLRINRKNFFGTILQIGELSRSFFAQPRNKSISLSAKMPTWICNLIEGTTSP